jgi:D-sedoheptulose 7-phosphate isomerase
VARALGLKTIGLTGKGGGKMATLCDILIDVPATRTFEVQELHLPVYHCLCAMVEAHFFS